MSNISIVFVFFGSFSMQKKNLLADVRQSLFFHWSVFLPVSQFNVPAIVCILIFLRQCHKFEEIKTFLFVHFFSS